MSQDQRSQFVGAPPQFALPHGNFAWGSSFNSPPDAAPAPAPAPAVLVSDVSRVLGPLFVEFKRATDAIGTLTESIDKLSDRLAAVEAAIKDSLGDAPDNEPSGAHTDGLHLAKRPRKSGTDASKTQEPQPQRHELHLMQVSNLISDDALPLKIMLTLNLPRILCAIPCTAVAE